jgi:hypothetical protein
MSNRLMVHQSSRVFRLWPFACAAACSLYAALGYAQPSLIDAPETSRRAVSLAAGQAKATSEITFSGYQSLPGGRGILFVEMTDPVAVEAKQTGQVIEYRLVGARVPLRNNKNPLLLRDFVSSALSAVLVPDKQAVRLVVTLRANVKPTHRLVARGKGAVLEIELPSPPQR